MSEPGRRAALAVGALLAVVGTAVCGVQTVDETSGEVRRVEHRVFSGDVQMVRVHTNSGRIQIAGAAGRVVDVEGSLAGTVSVPAMSAEVRDGVLTLDADCGGGFWDCEASFAVRVPAGIRVVAETGSGEVEATGLLSAATLRSGSGTVRVDGARAQLTMSTASGNLRAVGVTATEVDASTASGNVRIELATAPEDISAHSASGNVRITVPDDGEVYATEVHTGSGNTLVGVRTDPLAARRLRASTGSGNAEIDYADPA